MDESRTVEEVMIPVQDVIDKDESVQMARRRFQSESTRSFIVVDGDVPLGVLEWRHIMHADPALDDLPVREVMAPSVPEVRQQMTLGEAGERLTDIDLSTIPVVDENGKLIGEVARSSIVRTERVTDGIPAAGELATDDTVDGPTTGDLEKGMTVQGSGGSKLGSLDAMVIGASGRLDAITVSHGLLGRKHKRVSADLVSHIDDDTVVLLIDSPEFKALPDVEGAAEPV